jgi:hypothetical protein
MKIKLLSLLFLIATISCSDSIEKATEGKSKISKSESKKATVNIKKKSKSSSKNSGNEIKAIDWLPETEYDSGVVVNYKDELWQSNRKVYRNTTPPDTWFWSKYQSKSEKIKNGGVDIYNLSKEYDSGSVVIFEEKKFISKRKVFLGTSPIDNWFWEEVK